MKKLTNEIIEFFRRQNFVIVSTIDKNGFAHSSCKGIVSIDKRGYAYLLDAYKAKTYHNLKRNPYLNITAIDEHKFVGYCLKGKAEILPKSKFDSDILEAWENKITSRLTHRLLKNIHGEKGHPRHPEAILPKPKYMIIMEIEDIVDLTPKHLK
jgi:general stress protein 26